LYWKYDAVKDQTTLIMANIFHTMNIYTWESKEIRRYNETLFMAKKWDFLAAESLLSPLLNMSEIQSKSDIYELYGDVLYSLQKSNNVVEVYYQKSLESNNDNLRVEKKISFLKEKGTKESWSWSEVSGSGKVLTQQDLSGSLEKAEKLDELKNFSQQRWVYMNYDTSSVFRQESLIKSSLDILEWGKEKRDW
jgi:hypothetical protein